MIRKVALLAVAGSIAVAGCGAGVNAESARPTQLTEGVNVSQNGIDVRNLFVLGPASGQRLPAGADLPVYGSLINNSAQADALTGVAAPGFAQIGTVQGGALELPTHQLVNLSGPTGLAAFVQLKGAAKTVAGGELVQLTLQFRNAQALTLNVPVITAQGEFATYKAITTPTPVPTAPTVTPTTDAGHGSTPTTNTGHGTSPTPAADAGHGSSPSTGTGH